MLYYRSTDTWKLTGAKVEDPAAILGGFLILYKRRSLVEEREMTPLCRF